MSGGSSAGSSGCSQYPQRAPSKSQYHRGDVRKHIGDRTAVRGGLFWLRVTRYRLDGLLERMHFARAEQEKLAERRHSHVFLQLSVELHLDEAVQVLRHFATAETLSEKLFLLDPSLTSLTNPGILRTTRCARSENRGLARRIPRTYAVAEPRVRCGTRARLRAVAGALVGFSANRWVERKCGLPPLRAQQRARVLGYTCTRAFDELPEMQAGSLRCRGLLVRQLQATFLAEGTTPSVEPA